MTKQATNNAAAAIVNALANLSADELNAIAAAIAAVTNEQPAAAAKPAAKAPAKRKAAAKKPAQKEAFTAGAWVTYIDDNNAPRFCKAIQDGKGLFVKGANGLVKINNVTNVKQHETQGKALQAYNAMKQTAKPAKPAPKRPEWLKGEHADKNYEILQAVKPAQRRRVENMLKRAINNGFDNAFLARNKKHQLDAISLYCGISAQGHKLQKLETKEMKEYRVARERAAANKEPKPAKDGVWFYSPARGGKLYMFGAFDA